MEKVPIVQSALRGYSMNGQLQPPIQGGWAWQFSWLNLSAADLIIVGLMIVVFVLAIIVPFPHRVGGDGS